LTHSVYSFNNITDLVADKNDMVWSINCI